MPSACSSCSARIASVTDSPNFERYPALVDGAFIIIAWVGIKLVIEYLHSAGYIHFEIPKWLSLGLIVVIFLAAFLYARAQEGRAGDRTRTDEDARGLLIDDEQR